MCALVSRAPELTVGLGGSQNTALRFTWVVEQVSFPTYLTEYQAETKATSFFTWRCCLPLTSGSSAAGRVGGDLWPWAQLGSCPATFSCQHSLTKGVSLCTGVSPAPAPNVLFTDSENLGFSSGRSWGTPAAQERSLSSLSSHGTGEAVRTALPTCSRSELSKNKQTQKNVLKNHELHVHFTVDDDEIQNSRLHE